jgi:hypothetical protein
MLGADQAPDQPGGEEAVVEALVAGHDLGLLGELGARAERRSGAGRGPQRHLEDDDVDVDGRHQGDQDRGEDRHPVRVEPLVCREAWSASPLVACPERSHLS